MARTVLTAPDISCEHCVRSVMESLSPVEGVQQVSVDIPTKKVTVEYDQTRVGIAKMREILAEEDYPVTSVAD